MSVLVISSSFNESSGTGRYTKAVVQELRRQGENVSVALTLQPDVGDVALEKGLGFMSVIRNITRIRQAAKGVHIVHALDAWPFCIYALAAVLGTRRRLLINGVGTYSVPPSRFGLKRILMLAAYARAKHIFSISSFTQKEILRQLPFSKSASVVHLAATQLPKPTPDILDQVRKKYQIPLNAKIVLTVGAIKYRKGQLDTLRGVLEAKKDIPNLLYVMVGSNEDHQYIASLEKEAGHQAESAFRIVADAASDTDLSAWYALADVFALNSNNERGHFEGFGLVFLEAAQFGVPGIGSKDCGIEDAIQNGITGFLVSQHDSKAIAKAIDTILTNWRGMSRAATSFGETFLWEDTVRSYRSQYE